MKTFSIAVLSFRVVVGFRIRDGETHWVEMRSELKNCWRKEIVCGLARRKGIG